MRRKTAIEGKRIGRRFEEVLPLESNGGCVDARTLIYPIPVSRTPSFEVFTSDLILFLTRKHDFDEFWKKNPRQEQFPVQRSWHEDRSVAELSGLANLLAM